MKGASGAPIIQNSHPIPAITKPLLFNLFGIVGRECIAETGPSLLLVGGAPFCRINPIRVLQNSFSVWHQCLIHLGGDEGSTSADTFGVEMSISFWYAGARQCADNSTSGPTCNRTSCGRSKPTGGDNRANTRNRYQAETSEQTACPADNSTDPDASSGPFGGIRLAVPSITTLDMMLISVDGTPTASSSLTAELASV